MPQKRLAYAAWTGYTVAVGVLSLMPGQDVPTFSLSDKVAHFAAYFLLAGFAPWFRGSSGQALATLIFAVCYGAALELGQGAMSFGRTPDLMDALANTAGAAAGTGLRYLWETRRA